MERDKTDRIQSWINSLASSENEKKKKEVETEKTEVVAKEEVSDDQVQTKITQPDEKKET